MMIKPLRIVSYNIRKAVGVDGKRAPERILDVINQLDADVVLLQEADKRLGERPPALPHKLIETGSDFSIAPVGKNGLSLGWHGNAMLLRKGLQANKIRQLDLPGLEPRGAIVSEITSDAGAFTVVGVHLALLRPWRRRQIQTIVDNLDDAEMARSVIAGDFNEWSEIGGLDAIADSHDILAPGKSFRSNLPLAALDRIALGGSVETVKVGLGDTPLARISSDHLPIWADLKIKPNAGEPK